MDPGWAAFWGAIGGSVATGAVVIVGEWIRYKRLIAERTKERVVSEKVNAYKKFWRMLVELWREVPLLDLGMEPLRWPKDRRISPQFFNGTMADEEKARDEEIARLTHTGIEKLKEFVYSHALVLPVSVQRAFWSAFGEFSTWRIRLRHRADGDMYSKWPNYDAQTDQAFYNLTFRPRQAMVEDLGVSGHGILSLDEIREIRRQERTTQVPLE